MVARRKSRPRGVVKLQLNERHPAQKHIIATCAQYNVLSCGRRFGKTDLIADVCVDGTDENDQRTVLRGAQIGWWVGKEDQFELVWTYVKELLDPITVGSDAKLHLLRFEGGGSIEFWSNGRRDTVNSGRSRKYHRAIIDEAAYNPLLEQAWELTIAPTLIDYDGDAWFMSSPQRAGYFKRLFEQGQIDSPYYRPGFKSWSFTSYSNPHIDPKSIDKMRDIVSDQNFRQEYLAEFIEGAGGWFKKDWWQFYTAAIDATDMNIVILVDPASGKKKTDGEDYTAIWVIGLGIDHNYYVLEFIRERFDLVERTQEVFRLVRQWKPQVVGYESYGMQSDTQHIEYVMNEVEHFRFRIHELGGSMPKEKRIERLIAPLKLGRLFIPAKNIADPRVHKTLETLHLWLDTEYVEYPATPHDDGLDCLARIHDLPIGFPNLKRNEEEERQKEALMRKRPRMTNALRGNY